jgi:hypothetical protein
LGEGRATARTRNKDYRAKQVGQLRSYNSSAALEGRAWVRRKGRSEGKGWGLGSRGGADEQKRRGHREMDKSRLGWGQQKKIFSEKIERQAFLVASLCEIE